MVHPFLIVQQCVNSAVTRCIRKVHIEYELLSIRTQKNYFAPLLVDSKSRGGPPSCWDKKCWAAQNRIERLIYVRTKNREFMYFLLVQEIDE